MVKVTKLVGGMYLKFDVNKNNKTIVLWCYNKENFNTNIPKNIENKINQYKEKKYKVCIFQSGKEDIKKNFLQLKK